MANFAPQAGSKQRERFTRCYGFTRSRGVVLAGACVLLAAVAGCGRKSRLTVAPVRGSVTYKAQGVPGALVIFFPVDETAELLKKLRPFGYADAEGKFELKSYVSGDGAPPGKYHVAIVAASSNSAASSGHDAPPGDKGAAKSAVAIPPEVIKKYGSADTSGLQVTIQNGENNLAPFTL